MKPAHRRHDIPDSTWKLLEPHLPGRKGTRGGLVWRINADYLIPGKGYDSDEIVDLARNKGMQVVIPPRKKPQTTA